MNWTCPIPTSQFDQIVIGHGGGGRLTQDLLRQVIADELGSTLILHDLDAGIFNFSTPPSELVFTTDSFVVDPIFFPGGDIGKLSVVGTVNDLAMMGAKPVAFSLAFILEEGFAINDFRIVLKSIHKELAALNLTITCGDTKVVPRGKGDRIYINTSAVGQKISTPFFQPKNIKVGDALVITRDIAAHGTAVLCARNQLGIKASIQSDCHELLTVVDALLAAQIPIHCARDLTRGGLLSAAVEIATTSQEHFIIEEQQIPIQKDAKSVCEMLGLDPYMIANEGTALFFIPSAEANRALNLLKNFEHCQNAAIIGHVVEKPVDAAAGSTGKCLLHLASGVNRRWNLPPGELLPRIC